jgi:hypothetical protein
MTMASQPLSMPQTRPATSAAPAPDAIVGTVPPVRLSALEWSVVAMAVRDGLSSIREPGRFLTALGSIFGFRRPNRLANDRLEALRRMAILAWHHHWNVPKSEIAAFLRAGFSVDHYELVQDSIGRARSARRRRTAR